MVVMFVQIPPLHTCLGYYEVGFWTENLFRTYVAGDGFLKTGRGAVRRGGRKHWLVCLEAT